MLWKYLLVVPEIVDDISFVTYIEEIIFFSFIKQILVFFMTSRYFGFDYVNGRDA